MSAKDNVRWLRLQYQQLQGLHVDVGDVALLRVLHHNLNKERALGCQDHLVDMEHLFFTMQLVVGQLPSLEHGQHGGVVVVEEQGFLHRESVLLLHLLGLCIIGPPTDGASDAPGKGPLKSDWVVEPARPRERPFKSDWVTIRIPGKRSLERYWFVVSSPHLVHVLVHWVEVVTTKSIITSWVRTC